jgi:integrase
MPRAKQAGRRYRTRGEGSLYEKKRTWTTRDGKIRSKLMWVAAISEGYASKEGRFRRRRKYFYASSAAGARMARDQYLAQAGKAVPSEAEREEVTIGEFIPAFIDHWKTHRKSNGDTRSAATLNSYEQTLRLHVEPYVGRLRVADLSPSDARRLYKTLEAKVSPSMQARAHVSLRVLLNYAVAEGIIAASPLQSIRQAAPKHKRPQVEPLNERQVRAVLKAAKGHRIADAMIALALDSGMRQGELFGLRWSEVDVPGRKIHVTRSAREVAGEITVDRPKSGSGRVIAISASTAAALERRSLLARKEGLQRCELVFPAERGGLLYKSNFLRNVWDPIRQAAELPKVRFHDLRHTCATLLLRANIHPKVVQERLGHASIALTMDTYSGSIPSMQAGAAKAIGDLLVRLGRKTGSGTLAVHGGTKSGATGKRKPS